jgi:hypothetical protein
LSKATAICRSMAVELRQISMDSHKYILSASASQGGPDQGRLTAFEVQRQAAIETGLKRLKQELSPGGWSGLYGHINGTHRQSIVGLPVAPSANGTSGQAPHLPPN